MLLTLTRDSRLNRSPGDLMFMDLNDRPRQSGAEPARGPSQAVASYSTFTIHRVNFTLD